MHKKISIDKSTIESRVKSATGWLFAIAAFSAVNFILQISGSSVSFLAGLGLASIAGAFATSPEPSTFTGLIGGILSVLAGLTICFLFICGMFSKERKPWAFLAGGIVYSIDILLVLLMKDWISAAFHIWAIYSIFTGYSAIRASLTMPPDTPKPPQEDPSTLEQLPNPALNSDAASTD